MRIAIGKKDPATGRYVFPVFIPFLTPITLEMEKVDNAKNDRAPSMQLLCGGEKCGALWKRQAKGASGESFLSGSIESPVFPGGRLDIAIFHSKDQGDCLDMTWRPRENTGEQRAESRPAASESTASTAGADDDDIPF
jgi:uncharacterized protein (DUF736 family)